jgi:HPt (histidine-containing phosphotransfer) domain-containing protein
MEEQKTFDYDKFLKHVLNKTDLAAEIMHIFFDDMNSFSQNLIKALETEDFAMLRKTAHRLKGSSLNVCAGKLSELFLRLEGIGKNNSIEGAAVLVGEIFGELENFRREVRNSNIIDN